MAFGIGLKPLADRVDGGFFADAGHDVLQRPARVEGEPPLRPLRLFDRPEPIEVLFAEVPDKPPRQFKWRRAAHTVVRAEGPERIAMEWWRSQQAMPTRDYFRVEDEAGMRFWLYRDGLYGEIEKDGKAVPPAWFVHGLFA